MKKLYISPEVDVRRVLSETYCESRVSDLTEFIPGEVDGTIDELPD